MTKKQEIYSLLFSDNKSWEICVSQSFLLNSREIIFLRMLDPEDGTLLSFYTFETNRSLIECHIPKTLLLLADYYNARLGRRIAYWRQERRQAAHNTPSAATVVRI
jgi:hypothetical protein